MKKVIIIVSLLGLSCSGFCQTEKLTKEKKTTFGFNIGGFQTMIKSDDALPQNFKINNSSGFRLGILLDQKLGRKFSISPKAELGFSSSDVSFSQETDINISKPIYNTHLEFMTHMVWRRSDLKINPYVLIGPSIRVPLTKENEISITNNYDAGIDIGFGFDKAFTHFNIMPEIRFSSGVMNILKDSNFPKVRYNSISLVFNFRG
ncbi:MAG: outer membrane beta-barrel protein [Vicingaceae bacterium]|nr:outer membrane beta-barrel protein [Vicingaceae bacterium]